MESLVTCEICGEEVEEPALDWCQECGKSICLDCIEAIDGESGMRVCTECYSKGRDKQANS